MIVEMLEAGKVYEFTANVIQAEFEAIKEWCADHKYVIAYRKGEIKAHNLYWLIPADMYQQEKHD